MIAFATAGSRIIGLVRDIVIAKAYGTGVVADAYYYVQLVTNNFFLTLGAFNGPIDSSIVAVLAKKEESERFKILAKIIRMIIMQLGLASLAAYMVAPLIIPRLALLYHPRAGSLVLADEYKLQFVHEVQVQFSLMLPMILLGALVGVLYGIARLHKKVLLPSLAPSISSLTMILVILPAHRLGFTTGWPLATGCVLGALMQFLLQLPGYRAKQTINNDERIPRDVDESVAEFKKLAVPALFTMLLGYLSIFVDGGFAMGLGTGAWTAVSYSNRLIQLPSGILSVSVLIPMFPKFAHAASNLDQESVQIDLHNCLRLICFVTLPFVAMLSALAQPIVAGLFEGDQFTQESVRIVTLALTFLAPQMLFSLGRELLTQIFWAFREAVIPLRLACVALVAKIALDALFVWGLKLDVAGISLATTCMSAINFTTLLILLGKRIQLRLVKLVPSVGGMLVAMLVAHVAAKLAFGCLSGIFGGGKLGMVFALVPSILVLGLTYVAICWVLRLDEVAYGFQLLRHALSRIRAK